MFIMWKASTNSLKIIFREKPQDAEWLDLRSRKVPLLLNFAQCKLSKKEYYSVIEHTTEVLESDPGKHVDDLIRIKCFSLANTW